MAKVRTIKLSDGHTPKNAGMITNDADWKRASRYRVEQITDSLEFHTGQLLERNEVDQLCESNMWKVTIVPIR